MLELLHEMERREHLRELDAKRELVDTARATTGPGSPKIENSDHVIVATSDGRGSASVAMATPNNGVAESNSSSTIATASPSYGICIATADVISNPYHALGSNARTRMRDDNNDEEAAHFQPKRIRLTRKPT